MAFHEGFWLVTGTAAPVIALAAVVSLADAGRYYFSSVAEATDATPKAPSGHVLTNIARDFFALQRITPLTRTMMWLVGLGGFNLILQPALLVISLVSLAEDANSVPPWLAIVAAVAGLLLLAVHSLGVVHLRLGTRQSRDNRG